MGGHTQFGEFYHLDEAMTFWFLTLNKYINEYHLWLKFGSITYNGDTSLYTLSMRFTK